MRIKEYTVTNTRYSCGVDQCRVRHRSATGAARCQLDAGPDRRSTDSIWTDYGRHIGRSIDLVIEQERNWSRR